MTVRFCTILTVAALIYLGGNPAPSLAQTGSDFALTTAQEHLALLKSHQEFLESMYQNAMILIGATAFVFVVVVTFFGFRTKGQIDEMVQSYFFREIKVRLENQFETLNEEMVSSFRAALRDAAAHVSDDLAGSNEAIADIEKSIEELRLAIFKIQTELKIDGQDLIKKGEPHDVVDPEAQAWKRMKDALLGHKFAWRSIERLGLEARIPPQRAEAILERHPDEVRLSTGKSGRRVARHLTREPKG